MDTGIRKIIYLPVEVYPRDMASRFLLACAASERGIISIYGDVMACAKMALRLRGGLYFDKCLATSHRHLHDRLTAAGVAIASMDEEGLSSENNRELYSGFRLSVDSANVADLIFCWGDFEKRVILQKTPGIDSKIVVAGNPRLDLAKNGQIFSSEREPYILLISNVATIHANGIGFAHHQLQQYGYLNEKVAGFFSGMMRDRWLTLFEMAKFYVTLATRYPGYKFILRPHPSESVEFWIDIMRGLENLHVEYDHEYNNAIANAYIVVHSSCTSGIFASLKGVRTLAYTPVNDEYSRFVANRVSTVQANTIDNALYAFEYLRTLDNKAVEKINSDNLSKNREFVEFDSSKPCAIRISQRLDRYFIEKSVSPIISVAELKLFAEGAASLGKGAHGLYAKATSKMRSMLRRSATDAIAGDLFPEDRKVNYTRTYGEQQFKVIENEVLDDLITKFLKSGLIDKRPVIKSVSDNLFAVLPNETECRH